ncbi:hypothetical protein ACSBR2_021310 [Camellia fascicularis]
MALVGRLEVKFAFFLGLVLLSGRAQGATRNHYGNAPTVFDVTEYGAKADGQTECAQAFTQAWNAACKSNGPSSVVIPTGTYLSGEVFFHGPCTHSKPITVEVHGTILAQSCISDFANGHWISVEDVDGLVLKGPGTFNGQGEESWQYDTCGGQSTCDFPLPPSIVFNQVNNSIIQGFNMVNSKGFHIKIGDSHNFTIQDLNINAPKTSPSTDGIHISQSDLVTISNCTIATGGQKCISQDEGATHIITSAINCIAPRP